MGGSMKNKVIEAAGKAWHVLGQKGPVKVSELSKLLKEKDEIALQALGWLSREDKIEYTQKARATMVSLIGSELSAFKSIINSTQQEIKKAVLKPARAAAKPKKKKRRIGISARSYL